MLEISEILMFCFVIYAYYWTTEWRIKVTLMNERTNERSLFAIICTMTGYQ